MAELKEYEVEINGWSTTVQLNDEDAEKRGLTVDDTLDAKAAADAEAEAQAAAEPERLAKEQADEQKPDTVEEKAAPTPANKARTAANKSAAK
ncbi:hypothetical protein [Rhodococcus tibetensis]|uniref:Uncharacterized protein n=1 Tax=Rhodococcus tibetensis TaxID=2965064 RepID=A0ABT1QDS5_9NOCA|nr:hypothetical protein [Rhodococcus sp. FXJ9.536]MCQ4119880.1 hypothetical protein [Rhodococcus sp. FXJ9.536]